MRTTLALPDTVFFAKQRAAVERVSMGEMISRVVRLGIQAEQSLSCTAPVISK